MSSDLMKNENLDRPSFLVRAKSLREIISDLRKAELWLMVAALAAFLASAFFVVKYFVGGEMIPSEWSNEQWMNAFLGLGITAVITSAQAFLYASGYKGHAAIIATCIVVFFGVFSEVAQSMEREDATVRSRSENSAVFKATLGSISALSTAPVLSGVAASELHRAQQQAAKIQARIDNKNRCKSCEKSKFHELRTLLADAKGRVAAAQSRADIETSTQTASNASALQQAISTAKQLEYDEDKHYAMIRLLKSLFGVTGIWASFLFSIIIIGTFEYAFHFVGAYVADHKQALLLLGRDTRGRRLDNGGLDNESVPSENRAPHTGYGDEQVTYNDELAKHGVDSPHDPAMNNPENRTRVRSIVERGTGGTVSASEFAEKRYYKLIYTIVRNEILSGKCKPTVRPVTDLILSIVREKAAQLGIKSSMVKKPDAQKMAVKILEGLEEEAIVSENANAGIGKAKYSLSPAYEKAIAARKSGAKTA